MHIKNFKTKKIKLNSKKMIYFYIDNLKAKENINFISLDKIQQKLLKNLIYFRQKTKKNLKKEED